MAKVSLVDSGPARRGSPRGRISSGRLGRRVCSLAALSLVTSLAFAGSAAAAVVPLTASCGQVLTDRNTYVLQNDVGPCSTDGIVIKNPGKGDVLTLDLNGHTIRGNPIVKDGSGKPIGGFNEGAGVRVVGSNKIVVTSSVSGATVRDFDAGVLLAPEMIGSKIFRLTTNSKVEKLNVTENEGFVPFGGGSDDEVTDFSDGIVLVGANNNTVSNNNAFSNGSGGIRLDDADNNTIINNTADSNRGNGIRFLTGNNGNLVTGNTSTNNRFSGISFSFTSPGNTVRDNVLSRNKFFGASTSFESERTTFDDNTIANNNVGGITLGSGENTLTANAVTANGFGAAGTSKGNGIFVGSGTDNFPRVGTTVSGNTVQGNAGNGIRVSCTIDQDPDNFSQFGCLNYNQHNSILNNVATGNAVNGPPGTKVKTGFQVVGFYDLLDSNNSDATPADPNNPPTDCDNNTWKGNTFNTAYPACTTAP